MPTDQPGFARQLALVQKPMSVSLVDLDQPNVVGETPEYQEVDNFLPEQPLLNLLDKLRSGDTIQYQVESS